MDTVRSKDGTTIAYEKLGAGQPVILVGGALSQRHAGPGTLAEFLAKHFTAVDYDRRGRGDSSDTTPYAVEREIEDLEALISSVGGSAFVYGISSGAVLALEAATNLPGKIKKLALYEPPFIVDSSAPPLPEDYVQQLNSLIAADRRGDAVALFMKVVGVPEEYIGPMRSSPNWSRMEQVAHTLAYDGTVIGDTMSGNPLPPNRWASATSPTLVIVGGESDLYFQHGTQALVDVLPNAHRRTLPFQGHDVDPQALAPLLIEFFQA